MGFLPLLFQDGSNVTEGKVATGVVHNVPSDLRKALSSDAEALAIWNGLTPLARNEWICWVISVKSRQPERNTSKGCGRNSMRECGDPAVGTDVFIVQISQLALPCKVCWLPNNQRPNRRVSHIPLVVSSNLSPATSLSWYTYFPVLNFESRLDIFTPIVYYLANRLIKKLVRSKL